MNQTLTTDTVERVIHASPEDIYTVTRPLTRVAWFILEKLIGSTDRAGELRSGMATTLGRLAELAERPVPQPER